MNGSKNSLVDALVDHTPIRSWNCIECDRRHLEPPHVMKFECKRCGELNWEKMTAMGIIQGADDSLGM